MEEQSFLGGNSPIALTIHIFLHLRCITFCISSEKRETWPLIRGKLVAVFHTTLHFEQKLNRVKSKTDIVQGIF